VWVTLYVGTGFTVTIGAFPSRLCICFSFTLTLAKTIFYFHLEGWRWEVGHVPQRTQG